MSRDRLSSLAMGVLHVQFDDDTEVVTVKAYPPGGADLPRSVTSVRTSPIYNRAFRGPVEAISEHTTANSTMNDHKRVNRLSQTPTS